MNIYLQCTLIFITIIDLFCFVQGVFRLIHFEYSPGGQLLHEVILKLLRITWPVFLFCFRSITALIPLNLLHNHQWKNIYIYIYIGFSIFLTVSAFHDSTFQYSVTQCLGFLSSRKREIYEIVCCMYVCVCLCVCVCVCGNWSHSRSFI